VPYDSCAIFLQEGVNLRIVAARGFPDLQKVLGQTYPTESPLTSEGFQTGKVIILPDAQQDARFQGWGDSSHVHGWMGVPMFARGNVTGFLTIDSRSKGAYSDTDAQLAQAFANQAAIAIENARLFEKVQHLAVTDPLTELYNRRHFFDLARREFYRSRRYGDSMSLIMLDVDDLKLVNDTYGHQAGDRLIQFIGEQCSSQLRQADIAARYAGDEFIIALPGTDLEGGIQVAKRIKDKIADGFAVENNQLLPVAATLGVSELDETCFSLEMLLTRADKAMYAAKDAGKNCIGACYGNEYKVVE
jgi:diguanylate cyclase (GGDEF)-like protein